MYVYVPTLYVGQTYIACDWTTEVKEKCFKEDAAGVSDDSARKSSRPFVFVGVVLNCGTSSRPLSLISIIIVSYIKLKSRQYKVSYQMMQCTILVYTISKAR